MKGSLWSVSIVFLLAWLLTTSVSVAQQPRRDAYFADPAVAPTVSPYLNLGVNGEGNSNYQSLVRPLLEQRAALARQAIATDRDQRQQGRFGSDNAGTGSRHKDVRSGQSARRFMNYSHYFGRGG